MNYAILGIMPFLIVYIFIPILRKIFLKIGFTDNPTDRKKHNNPKPLCGGIGIYVGFFITYSIFLHDKEEQFNWIFIASTLILGIGLVDDYYKSKGKEFPIYPRLIVQLTAAFIVYKSGIVFEGFTSPFNGTYIVIPTIIQFILTMTWIFGVTTVINWSDGMDGLAGGLSIISALTFFVAALILGQEVSAMTSIILAGAIFGFWIYNKYPATVFMGDSGANFIGFILSIITLDGAFKQATVLSVFIPILALAVPIFDNIFVVLKRFFSGKPVYQADRSQMHYRLEQKGLKTKECVNYILMISLICSLISIIILLLN